MSVKRRKKQISLYLDGWLKRMVEESSTNDGKTVTAYIEGLVREDLGLSSDYSPKEITITYLPDGTSLYDVMKSNSGVTGNV